MQSRFVLESLSGYPHTWEGPRALNRPPETRANVNECRARVPSCGGSAPAASDSNKLVPRLRSAPDGYACPPARSEEHTSELQSHSDLVCRLLLEKKK